MTYLYAITDQPHVPLPPGPGLTGAPLLSVCCREIAAVVSPLATTEIPPTPANVWQHEMVVEALMAGRTVLPMRFGTMVDDLVPVVAMLAARHDDLGADLSRLRGYVEVGVRVLGDGDSSQLPTEPPEMLRIEPPGGEPLACSPGAVYLRARLEQERQARTWQQRMTALAAEFHTDLTPLAAESTYRVLATPRLLLTASYLVARHELESFRAAVGTLAAANPTVHFLCTGPWPPYSFVRATVLMGKPGGQPCRWPILSN